MKLIAQLLLCALWGFIVPMPGHADGKFVPKPNSPLARAEHPRLFFAKADIADLRAKIQRVYQPDFQNFIADLDRLYTVEPGSGPLTDWNHVFGAARSFALAYRIDPATIRGTAAGYSKEQYGRKAIALGLYLANNLPDKWIEEHHGASVLTTRNGGLGSLALQVVYDYTTDLATIIERRKMADKLITLWDNRYRSSKVKLENHYAANVHIYAGALCFYGDSDLGPSYTAKAKVMMDSFQDVFIERQLGVAERLFEGRSDWIEGDSYSMDAYLGLMLLGGAASSALGENLFISSSWLHYAPYYIYFNIMPMPYKGEYYFVQHNTSKGMTANDNASSSVMNIAAAMLWKDDPRLASFAAWFCEKSPYGLDVDDFKYYEPHIYDFFYKLAFGTRQVLKRSPDEAGIELSVYLGQAQAMRSDHTVDQATLIQFFCTKFWYPNGHNEQEAGAFTIHRFGSLALSTAVSKNAGRGIPRIRREGKAMVFNNVFGLGGDPGLSLDMGSIDDTEDTPADYVTGAKTQIGAVEAKEYRNGLYDYLSYNYTRAYKGGNRASLARRALVYLRGQVNHEYVVVMDRVRSTEEKYFVLHTPVDIVALDDPWVGVGNGHWISHSNAFKVTNRIDRSHGQMYLTSVLPQHPTVHKIGGPGHEWVWADGTPLEYDKDDFHEIASYLFGDHTLEIRSPENQFLTVMQIGDAYSMGKKAAVESLAGTDWVGAYLGSERVIIFAKDEQPLTHLTYTIAGNSGVRHLITELQKNSQYTVSKAGTTLSSGSTGENGTIYFQDNPSGRATYSIALAGSADSN